MFLEWEGDILWLKHNTEPYAEVIERWNKTFPVRKGDNSPKSVAEFLTDWPILRDLRSDVLVRLVGWRIYGDAIFM